MSKKYVHPTKISFASALNNSKKNVIEESTTLLPGWVYIKKINGKINYKYGVMTDNAKEEERQERKLSKIFFKQRIARLQWNHDLLNNTLGDLSPYWESKTLYELFNLSKDRNYKKKNISIEKDSDVDSGTEWTYISS
jgi:hypothetical protein